MAAQSSLESTSLVSHDITEDIVKLIKERKFSEIDGIFDELKGKHVQPTYNHEKICEELIGAIDKPDEKLIMVQRKLVSMEEFTTGLFKAFCEKKIKRGVIPNYAHEEVKMAQFDFKEHLIGGDDHLTKATNNLLRLHLNDNKWFQRQLEYGNAFLRNFSGEKRKAESLIVSLETEKKDLTEKLAMSHDREAKLKLKLDTELKEKLGCEETIQSLSENLAKIDEIISINHELADKLNEVVETHVATKSEYLETLIEMRKLTDQNAALNKLNMEFESKVINLRNENAEMAQKLKILSDLNDKLMDENKKKKEEGIATESLETINRLQMTTITNLKAELTKQKELLTITSAENDWVI